ncbi:MAG: hypothetical protein AAGA57_07195 [Planctomycetota bacterium]
MAQSGRVADGFDPLRARRAQAAPLEAGGMRDLHSQVERWTRLGEVAANAPAWPVSDALGVRVTLFIDGQVFGVGEKWRPNPHRFADEPLEPTDLADLARIATNLALVDAQGAAIRQAQDANAAGGPAVAPLMLHDMVLRFSVSVEVAHDVRRLDPAPGEPPEAAAKRAYPGVDGVLGRNPATGQWAVDWPSAALLDDRLPEEGYGRVRLEIAAGPETELFAFRTWHAARHEVDRPASVLLRGAPRKSPGFLDGAGLTRLLGRQGRHLTRRVDLDGSILGGYDPRTNRSQPLSADRRAPAAFALWSLARYANQRVAWTRPDDPFERAELDDLRARLDAGFARWGSLLPAEGEADTTGLDAVFLLAALDHPFGADAQVRDALAARVAAADPASLRTGAAALAGAALADWALRTGDANAAHRAGEFATTAAQRVAQDKVGGRDLPWLAELARRWPTDAQGQELHADQAAQLRTRLRGLAVDVIRHGQVDRPPAGAPRDVVGAFVLDRDPSKLLDPTWRTAPTLYFVAVGLGDERLLGAGPDAFGPMLAGASAAAFVNRLTLGPDATYLAADPDFSVGGVRAALWDQSMPIEATALSLLALLELYDASQRMEQATTDDTPP